MANKPQIGVRYCGGCNPMYDRAALGKRLAAIMPEYDFVPVVSGESYDAVVILHGCLSRCTKLEDINVRDDQIVGLNGFNDLLPAKAKIKELVETGRMLSEEDYINLDSKAVSELLPQKAPMLFVDSVPKLVPGVSATCDLYLDPQWDLFKGHFPGSPVFPGALCVEAIAQAADIMLLATERYKGKAPLFMGIDNASFRKALLPGQNIEIKASLVKEFKDRNVCVCKGQILCDGEVYTTAQISIAFR